MPTMKRNKILTNDPSTCVDDFLQGLALSHSGLIKLPDHRVILRKDLQNIKGKVAILSGGGAGHEPAHAGFVGKGMLTGAISGSVFTSPAPMSILAAIRSVNKFEPLGILLIVTNYTGDRLNFGLAREWALEENMKVEMVIVGEDCAFTSVNKNTGRRGLAGTVFVHKIAGALAEQGAPMDTIIVTVKEAIQNMGTIGVCLRPCTLPEASCPSFDLGESDMELGLGIHGEAGIRREKLGTCAEVVETMLRHIDDPQSSSRFPLNAKDEVVVLVNNLGGTSNLEMGIVTKEVYQSLSNRGITVKRIYSGSYMTSLQMAGVSLTFQNLTASKVPILPYLDFEATVAAPLITVRTPCLNDSPPNLTPSGALPMPPTAAFQGPKLSAEEAAKLKECLEVTCRSLIQSEEELNELDRGSGDGDCGSTLARGARQILRTFTSGDVDCLCPATVFQTIGSICSEKMGGTSGALYSIFMTAVARHLSRSKYWTIEEFANAYEQGLDSVKRYGGAQVGDRTMVDVLEPVLECLQSKQEPLRELCCKLEVVSKNAAKNTIAMTAMAGRASYVRTYQQKYPDPGAEAVSRIIASCVSVLSNKTF